MRYLSLFSGIEAATVAWHPLGWECVGVAEIEPFPYAVLAHHYPDVPNLGDVTRINEAQIKALGHVDVVVFGSPCQDLSVAGHRKGLINADGTVTRSGLFFTAINIARWSGARFWLWENVAGAYSSNKGRDFASVVEFMAGLDSCDVPPRGWATEGVAVGDNGLLEWACLDAQWFGVAQRRRRVFALADLGDWTSRPPILLEPESLRGDYPPSREAGERVTGGAAKGTGVSVEQPYPVANCLTRRMHKGINSTPDEGQTPVVTHSLIGGFDYENNAHGPDDPTGPLLKGSPTGGGRPLPAIVTHSLRSHANAGVPPAVAYGIRSANTSSNGWGISEELTHTLDQAQPHAVATRMQVRRLTPVECERLQGFPDNYTNIPWRGKPTSPDGPRYKAIGNSMAVPVMRWIGESIARVAA